MAKSRRRRTRPTDIDLSGRELGDYRLLRRLGHGAMADVYLAEQGSLSRQVALKVLKSDLAEDETYVKRFQREAQAAAALTHANIVQIHEVGRIDNVYFIAQEYVQGLNLKQWLDRNGPPDLRLALIIMRQVAAALTKAAEQGIVHRDIKPENILITRSGEVKVADFGLARLPQKTDKVALTQVGMTMGTPLYMSPEQVEGKRLDCRSDLYSFGVTCYDMLAGVPPFEGETALTVAVQHLKKTPQALENLRSDLPPALCRIVHKMLAKAPESRYQTPRELLRELHKLQMEHLGEDWPEDLAGLETAGLELAVSTRTATTRRLDALMKTATVHQLGRRGWIGWILGGAAAFVLGAAMAWIATAQTSLLAQTDGSVASIPRYDRVSSQWFYAMQVDTEKAWKAVVEYFPSQTSWVFPAKQHLAWIYLMEDDDQAAWEIFREFAELDEINEELRAFGLAGQCWILTKQEKHDESAAVLRELWPLREELEDRQMQRLLDASIQKNRAYNSQLATQQWEDWLAEQMAEDEEVPPDD